MTSSPKPRPSSGSTLARILLVFGVLLPALIIGAFVAGAAALRSLRAPAKEHALHRDLLEHLDASTRSSVEITLPGWMATLGRTSASLMDLDPEVKAALQAVGGGQVGVYELEEQPPRLKRLELIDRADQALEPDGWTRVVTVLDKEALVAAYVSDTGQTSRNSLTTFVIVMDDRELVMVSAKAYPRPLIELASKAMARDSAPCWRTGFSRDQKRPADLLR